MIVSAKRLALSTFLVLHLSAVVAWNMPDCAAKTSVVELAGLYLMPTGQWQQWGMFAPEPSKDTQNLEAVVQDSRGIVHRFAFPRMMDRSAWEGFLGGFRHSKYACNVGSPDGVANREVAARHVVRALNLPREVFPVDVQLVYQVWPTNPPAAPADEPPIAPFPSVIQTYRFDTPEEAQP